MSAFDTYRMMRDSTLRNGESARDEEAQQNALLARQQAGGMIAGGDLTGGANALLGAGDVSGGLDVINYGRRQDAAGIAAQRAGEDRQRATVLAGAQGLMRLPEEQWLPAFTSQVAPALEEVGLGHLVGQIAQDGITRQELEAVIASLGGEIEDPRVLQGQRGAVDLYDPYSRSITNVRPAAAEEAPNGYRWAQDGSLQAIRGGPADPQVVSSRAAAGRAPPRARAAGGAPRASGAQRSPAGGGLPPGFTVRRP